MSLKQVVVALSLAALFGALAVAPASAGWTSPLTFAPGRVAGDGGLAVDASGTATIGWIEGDPEGATATAHLQRLAADGAPSGPATTLGAAAPLSRTAVGVAPDGRGLAAWVDADDRLQAVRFAPDGSIGAPVQLAPASTGPTIAVAVDAAGDATVAWVGPSGQPSGASLFLARIRADGTVTPAREAGPGWIDPQSELQLAIAPQGTAWAIWSSYDGGSNNEAWVARFEADGAPPAATRIASSSEDPSNLSLGASAAGAAASWQADTGRGTDQATGVRLPASGPLIGEPLAFPATADMTMVAGGAVGIADDGTVTQLWTEVTMLPMAVATFTRRTLANGTTTAPQPLALEAGRFAPVAKIVPATDGSVQVLAVASDVSGIAAEAVAWRIAPDGTPAKRAVLGPFAFIATTILRQPLLLAAGPEGAAWAGWYRAEGTGAALLLSRFSPAAPQLDVSLPATAVVGGDARFAATVRYTSEAERVEWNFGDGSGASGAEVAHAYGRPGTYEVTATATMRDGETAVVRRTLTVTAAPFVTPPPPKVEPVIVPAGRAPAGLRVVSVVRTGAKVTVRGTIDRRADGWLLITYRQRTGGRARTVRAIALPARGRFATTLRLTGRLARATRGRATVTVAYGGDARLTAASAQRAVSAGRATRGSRRRGAATRGR